MVFTESANGPNRKNGFCDFSSDFMANKRIDGVPNQRGKDDSSKALYCYLRNLTTTTAHAHTKYNRIECTNPLRLLGHLWIYDHASAQLQIYPFGTRITGVTT